MTDGKNVADHELEFHAFDEDVRRALWGPLRKPVEGGGRLVEKGIVNQVQTIVDKADKGFKLATGDKLVVALLVVVAETIRIVWG